MERDNVDKILLDKFEQEIWNKIPHVENSKIVNPTPLVDLTDDPDAQSIKTELMAELSKICDPVLVDQSAKSTQARMVEENGGKPAIIERGDLGFSVPPGVAPMFD